LTAYRKVVPADTEWPCPTTQSWSAVCHMIQQHMGVKQLNTWWKLNIYRLKRNKYWLLWIVLHLPNYSHYI